MCATLHVEEDQLTPCQYVTFLKTHGLPNAIQSKYPKGIRDPLLQHRQNGYGLNPQLSSKHAGTTLHRDG